MNDCKQLDSVKIVRCPKFQKRLSENEFHELVKELDSAEDRAEELSKRVKDLIARAVSGETGNKTEESGGTGNNGEE
jgi:predicted transcriptional regulator